MREVIGAISRKTNVSEEKVSLIISEMHEVIMENLQKGDLVKVAGFGTFAKKKETKRNPKLGAILNIPLKQNLEE